MFTILDCLTTVTSNDLISGYALSWCGMCVTPWSLISETSMSRTSQRAATLPLISSGPLPRMKGVWRWSFRNDVIVPRDHG